MSAAPVRFASVDALRGLTVAAMLLVNTPGDWSHVYAPLLHAEWHGVTPTDLVFPFFLFIVGVSVSLGIVPRAEAGVARDVLVRALLWRAAKIVALGLALHLLAYLMLDRAHVRPWGVLQRIGVCFAIVGLVALYAKPRTQWALIGVILLGYWATGLLGYWATGRCSRRSATPPTRICPRGWIRPCSPRGFTSGMPHLRAARTPRDC